ncbi:protein kinase [Stieleria sp. TO1_6]|uniref:serine/threonine-protein kinase n=1 Tax=Stieleria tagensis TaxID=2956795 RepID=UPI00209A780F|nr:serine/threonine-protein kinase [Stieleria tagensis]MCO8121985.1 protein kinase [Stieleria tagensis]
MTPAMYLRVKEVFAAVVALPLDQRQQRIDDECGSNTELRNEVQSLLRYHSEKSLIETASTIPSAATFKNTRDFSLDPRIVVDPAKPPRAGVGDLGIDRSSELEWRFAQSTQHLLRSRLIAAIGLVVLVGTAITIFGIVGGTITSVAVIIRSIVFLILAGTLYLLRFRERLSLKQLRWLELLVVAAPMLELMWILVRGTNLSVATGNHDDIDTLRAMVSTATAIHIAIYGILIPATWQRTAAVTVTAALMPSLVVMLHEVFQDHVAVDDFMHYANPMLTLLMAMVATIGAHIVHQVRHQAAAAQLYGQYRLTEEIGRGAMGVVYRAEHQLLKRPAAIKLIRYESATDESAIRRFEDEVQISATLTHWNTVQIYDYGRTESGDFYYVMEYLDGESVAQRLIKKGTLSLEKTISIISQTCAGLADAHHRGMVHRDIKPSNLFLAQVGGIADIVKIVDFGLATSMTMAADGGHSEICGTPSYMSPEQIRGDRLDGRSDLYAIGCVAVECLTGAPPFSGLTTSMMLSEQLFRVPDLSSIKEIDPPMAEVLQRCLAKDRNDRFDTVLELQSACEKILRDRPSTER